MKRKVWMFSGQGAQYYNMGRDLYEGDSVFHEWMDQCDEIVRRHGAESFLSVLYSGPTRSRFAEFSDLHHTHPALFSIQYSLAQTLLSRGMKPDLLLGYSLGELVAAAVGGAVTLETALKTVVEQSRLFTAASQPGAMLAVMASPSTWHPHSPLYADTWLAARNAPEHFVLAATPAIIDRLQQQLQAREILFFRLPVTVAFHSPLIDSMETPFKARLEYVNSAALRYPLISAAYVAQLTQLPPGFGWEVVRRPVRFQETAAWLESRGPAAYVDLGPSGTLAGFLKYGLAASTGSTIHPIMTPFNRPGDTLRRMEMAIEDTGC